MIAHCDFCKEPMPHPPIKVPRRWADPTAVQKAKTDAKNGGVFWSASLQVLYSKACSKCTIKFLQEQDIQKLFDVREA